MSKVVGTRKKTGGRTKGTPNKISADIRDMMYAALNDGEGALAYFIQQKEENSNSFNSMLAKLLPKQIEGDIEHTIKQYVITETHGKD